MNKLQIYTNDWLKIHPYTAVQPSDSYFVILEDFYNLFICRRFRG